MDFTQHGPFVCLRGNDVYIDATYDEVLWLDDPRSKTGIAFFQKGTLAVHDGDSFRRTAELAPNLTLTFDDDGNVIDCDISPKPSILSWEVTTKPVDAPPPTEP